MLKPAFGPERMRDFNAYQAVQKKGRYNMLDARARILAGLSDDDFVFILDNYEGLQAQAAEEAAAEAS